MATNTNKKQFLCLHGKEQNRDVFKGRLGRLRHKARAVASFEIIEAPHDLPIRDGNEFALKTWYFREADGIQIEAGSLEQSLALIEMEWNSKLGTAEAYSGVLGFSQGGTLTGVIANMPARFPGLDMVSK